MKRVRDHLFGPVDDEMRSLGLFILAVVVLGLVWASISEAAVPKYWVSTTGTIWYDSSDTAPDSVYLFWIDGATATWDSAAMAPGRADSLVWVYLLDANTEGWVRGYNPTAYAQWFWGDFQPKDGNPQMGPSWLAGHLDSLDQAITATATIDYDTAASIIADTLQARVPGDWAATGGGGSGANTVTLVIYDTAANAVVPDANVRVYAPDTSGLASGTGPQTSDVNGVVTFSLDDATYPVDVGVALLFMATAYDPVVVSGATTDTIEIYSFSPTVPPGGDSCNVVIFTESAGSWAQFDPAPGQSQDTSLIFLNLKPRRAEADAVGVIQQALPRSAATNKNVLWNVTVHAAGNNVIGRVKDYTVPNQAVDTLALQ